MILGRNIIGEAKIAEELIGVMFYVLDRVD